MRRLLAYFDNPASMKVLRTLEMDNQYTMQNSTEFVDFVFSQRVTDDQELASLDV